MENKIIIYKDGIDITHIKSFKGLLAWILPSYIFRWLYRIENIGPFHSTWFGVNKMSENTTPIKNLVSYLKEIVTGKKEEDE